MVPQRLQIDLRQLRTALAEVRAGVERARSDLAGADLSLEVAAGLDDMEAVLATAAGVGRRGPALDTMKAG